MMPWFRTSYIKDFSSRGDVVRGSVFCLRLAAILLFCLIFSTSVFSADLSLDQIIQNIQANQSRIKDMYAETTTTITSNLSLPGSTNKGPQKIVQKAKMWIKGKDKSKIETLSPMRQITITNGDKMTIINSDSGQTITQDLSKIRAQSGMPGGSTDISKALDYFDLSVEQRNDQYVITGKPRQANKFLGSMEFYVDPERWLPVRIAMYSPNGKVMSTSDIEYKQVSDVWVAYKNTSNAVTPMGTIKTEIVFENVKVNQGIKNSEFLI